MTAKAHTRVPERTDLYDTDIVAWAKEQARLLRAGRLDRLDIEHLAEEIEDVGKSEQRELASRMAFLLSHLLTWRFQPERRGASWETTIRTQRAGIQRRLRRTPSLARSLEDPDWWADAWTMRWTPPPARPVSPICRGSVPGMSVGCWMAIGCRAVETPCRRRIGANQAITGECDTRLGTLPNLRVCGAAAPLSRLDQGLI